MSPDCELQAVWLTFKLALLTTTILLLIGTPLAWWLAQRASWLRGIVSASVALPLVLPPTVLGFYLLLAQGPRGAVGQAGHLLGFGSLAFTFPGLVIGSVLYSLPFVVQPLQNSFEIIGRRYLEAAAMLGASPLDQFLSVAVPLARPGFFTAAILGFAHTVGEFGVVLMIGGNIPGKTQVISIAIFNHVETMDYGRAHALADGMIMFSFLVLLALGRITQSLRKF